MHPRRLAGLTLGSHADDEFSEVAAFQHADEGVGRILQTIDDVFTILKEELRSQYSLGYVSDVPIHTAEFRKIQLKVNQKGLIVQSRDRYWAHH